MTATGVRRRAVAVVAVLVAAVVVSTGGPAGAGPGVVGPPVVGPRIYRPPVDAPVVDPFRPPPEPWLAGNRGLEYATVPGTPVGAIGPGVVVFAGPVAGSLYVTILHPDGLRSSYSYLAAIRVAVGDRVLGGQVVGIAGSVFHLGVRRGDVYLDPALLFGTPVEGGTVFLVPSGAGERPRPWGPRGTVATLVRRPATRWAEQPLPPRPSHGRRPEPSGRRSGPGFVEPLGEEKDHDAARRDHEAAARGRGALRAPDPALEPEDEAVHLR